MSRTFQDGRVYRRRVQARDLRDGDGRFRGVNARLQPDQVPEGYVSAAVNKRFTDGAVATREGIRKLGWTNRLDQTSPSLILPYGTTYNTLYFRDPSTNLNWLLVAANGKLYKTREGNGSTEVPLPVGVTLAAPIFMVQAFNQVLMLRGPAADPLYLTAIDEGFKVLPAAAAGNIKTPRGRFAVVAANRVWVVTDDAVGLDAKVYGVDCVFATAPLSVTEGSATNILRINQGTADRLVSLYRFNDDSLVAFKEQGIYILSGIYDASPNLSGLKLDAVTQDYGCRSPRGVAQVGKDLWFMADRRGVCSITQTLQNKLQLVDVPVSRDLQPVIDRIDWAYSAAIAGVATPENLVYFAAPLDNSEGRGDNLYPASWGAESYTLVITVSPGTDYIYEATGSDQTFTCGSLALTLASAEWTQALSVAGYRFTADAATVTITGLGEGSDSAANGRLWVVTRGHNNAVMVFDLLQQASSGYDSSPALNLSEWTKFEYGGSPRLGFVSLDGYLNLYESGAYDEVGDTHGNLELVAIEDSLTTRGYTCSDPDVKRFLQGTVDVATWNPSVTFTASSGGAAESQSLRTTVTRSRTKYFRPHDRIEWREDNLNDDFLTPWREDYAFVIPAGGMFFDGAGVANDVKQQWRQSVRISRAGDWCQLTITNTRGRCDVRGVGVTAIPVCNEREGQYS